MIRLEQKRKQFWEGETKGKVLHSRWGKLGTDGRRLKKSFRSDWEATSALEGAVTLKLKQGYKRAKTAQELELERPPKVAARRDKELEAAIAQDLDDPSPWLVYADWLQRENDPRGELIVLQHAQETKKSKRLRDRELAILDEHGDRLLGSLRKWPATLDGKHEPTFTWRRGFLHGVRISYSSYAPPSREVDMPAVLAEILAHPSAALVQELVLAEYNTGTWDKRKRSSQVFEHLTDVVIKAKPVALRSLIVGEYEFPADTEISWVHIGNLGRLWKACPRLERLRVQGGSIALGAIDAPNLREATFVSGGLPRTAVQSIAAARWPKLEGLEIWFGDRSYGAGATLADIQPILDGKGLPALRHLGLVNADFTDELAAAIGAAPIVRQLASLDVSKGTLTDVGAVALAASKPALRHLKQLDVSSSYIDRTSVLKGVAAKVLATHQRTPDDYDGELRRYPSVGE